MATQSQLQRAVGSGCISTKPAPHWRYPVRKLLALQYDKAVWI